MSDTRKTYLITGANKGLGLGLVSTILAKEPTSTVVATVRAPAGASDLLALQKANVGRLEIIKMDVVDEASIKAASEEVAAFPLMKEHGLDVLVLNAGLCAGAADSIATIKAADLDDNLKVNLFGAMWTAQQFLPLVRAGRSKRIAYMSSAAGSIGLAMHVAKPGDISSYGVSKAAGNYYFANLGRELESEGIQVDLYMPGLVDTGMTSDFTSWPKLSPTDAAGIWYEKHIVAPLRPTGSFFNEQDATLPW